MGAEMSQGLGTARKRGIYYFEEGVFVRPHLELCEHTEMITG